MMKQRDVVCWIKLGKHPVLVENDLDLFVGRGRCAHIFDESPDPIDTGCGLCSWRELIELAPVLGWFCCGAGRQGYEEPAQ